VWSIKATQDWIVSGAADMHLRVWDAHTGNCLRRLRGHEATVSVLDVSSNFIASGDTLGHIRVWETSGSKRNPARHVACTQHLRAHRSKVTALQLSASDMVSGDLTGKLAIWDVKGGRRLHKMRAHAGSVTCIAFDAVKVVSGGLDRCVVIHDIVSGARISRMPEVHASPVVALQFDVTQLLSVGRGGELRFWDWVKVGDRKPMRRTHIIGRRERMFQIAKMYEVKVLQLCQWNGVRDPADFYPGQTIFVEPDSEHAPALPATVDSGEDDSQANNDRGAGSARGALTRRTDDEE
jgi:WD40 repeat protein